MKTFLKRFKIVNWYLRFKKIKKSRKSGIYDFNKLKSDLVEFGIKKGDSVFVHSSLSRLGYVEGGAETVISAFLEIIGNDGTLIFPSFSFPGGGLLSTIQDKNYIFDSLKEPSSVGHISEVFRNRPGVHRSNHPTHSVTATGKNGRYITENHIETGSNFGEGTPFKKMLEMDVKMIGLGVKLPMFTFFHCVEDLNLNLFPGLYHHKKISVKFRIKDKIEVFEVPYHNPEFISDRIEKNNDIEDCFTNYFISSKKLKVGTIGSSTSILISSKDFYNLTLELAKKNKTIYKV